MRCGGSRLGSGDRLRSDACVHAGQATGCDSRAGDSVRALRWAIAARISRIGRGLRTSGTRSKLCGSGGERVSHSSDSPPQGSWPASAPPLREKMAFKSVITIPIARTRVPIEAIRLSVLTPVPLKYL